MGDEIFYILDSYGAIFRAYFAMAANPLRNAKGENVSAIHGFFNGFVSFLQHRRPKHLACALDSKTKTFRHEIFPQYKANRPPTPPDLHEQIDRIEAVLDAMGVFTLRSDGFEADDVIASVVERARRDGKRCWPLSADKDLLQLVDEQNCVLRPDKQNGWTACDVAGVQAAWGVLPSQIRDFLSLLGDSADNVPGVKGIGKVGAAKLLGEYGSLDGIYANLGKIAGSTGKKLADGRDDAFFSQKLIELRRDVPLDFDFAKFSLDGVDFDAGAKLLHEYGLFQLAKNFAAFAEKNAFINAAIAKREADLIDFEILADEKSLDAAIPSEADCASVAVDVEEEAASAADLQACAFSFDGKKAFVADAKLAPATLQKIFASAKTVACYDLKPLLKSLSLRHLSAPKCKMRDEKIAAWLLDSDRTNFDFASVAQEFGGILDFDFSEKAAGDSLFPDFSSAAKPLAAKAIFLRRLDESFRLDLQKLALAELFESVEMPLVEVLAKMELEGIRIDREKLASLKTDFASQIAEIQSRIFAEVGREFNIASPKQLQEVLFAERGLKGTKKTQSGFSTDESVLRELAEIDVVPDLVLQYRGASKLLSTYVETLPKLADAKSRVHTTFVQTGTATGRLSSRDPNLQNIPVREAAGRQIRSAFAVEPGRRLISADYSQIELVMMAHLSGDNALRHAFLAGEDVHRATASLIFSVPGEAVQPEMRRLAKTINFGVIYGMSAFRLAKDLGISRSDAQRFIDAYFATYSRLRSFIDETISLAERNLFVETIMRRRRHVPGLLSKNHLERSAAERVAVNTVIQGSAADLVKLAMLRLDRKLAGTDCKMILQVHDELIFECDESSAEKWADFVKREMESVIELAVPLKVSVEIGGNWGEFH